MSFTSTKRDQIKNYILEKIDAHDDGFIGKTVSTYGISDKTVYRYLQEMVNEGILVKDKKQYSLCYDEAGFDIKRAEAEKLGEDMVYTQNILKYVDDLKSNVRAIWDYGFTEIMNNAIDHSNAEGVKIIVRKNRLRTSIAIIDDGIGIFENIKNAYDQVFGASAPEAKEAPATEEAAAADAEATVSETEVEQTEE